MSTAPHHPRLPDADARLQRLVLQRLSQPFEWGVHDCALFVADAARAVTGRDPAPDLRHTYRNAAGAHRALCRRLGRLPEAELLPGICAQRLGAEIDPALAQPGDAGLTEQAGRALLAVCVGAQWLAPGPLGLEPVAPPTRAWRADACRK